MANKKTTSRIIKEMNETMRGLHLCGALTSGDLEKFINRVEEKAKSPKSLKDIKTDKPQPSESLF